MDELYEYPIRGSEDANSIEAYEFGLCSLVFARRNAPGLGEFYEYFAYTDDELFE